MNSKKLFLSADIEGIAGIDTWDETTLGEGKYAYFAQQMTREVSSVCLAAGSAGFDVTVKDAHSSARNLDLMALPENASVLRGWIRDPYCMMGGINRDKYDFAAFTGYHSDAMSIGNPLSHTMTTSVQKVLINGNYASEFVINSYIVGYIGIPVIFMSGDAALCDSAKAMIPGITTVASKTGFGGGVLSKHPETVCSEIKSSMAHALEYAQTEEGRSACTVIMPQHFTVEIEYKEWVEAYKLSFYPGAVYKDSKTVSFSSDDYYEVMRFMHFCL